jgi:PAS domain S-box-containing protein
VNKPSDTPKSSWNVDAGLLDIAYGRMRLNVQMTFAAAVIGGGLILPLYPLVPMLAWMAALLFVVAAGYVQSAAFQRAAPALDELAFWQRLFTIHYAAAGAAWALGPTLMMAQVTGLQSTILVGTLLCVCAVVTVSMAAQRAAMQAFLATALVPSAMAAWHTGGNVEQVVAVVLLGGLGALVLVGRNSHLSMRALLETQSTLRESEERFRTLIEFLPEALVVHRGGTLIYVNGSAIKMFGARSAQDLVGKRLLDLIHPDFHQIVLARAKRIADHVGGTPMIENRYLKLDGTALDVESQITSIVYNGEPATLVVVHDISERKATERQLALFRRVFDSSSQCIGIADHKGRFIYQNSAQAQELGYPEEEIVGQPFTMVLNEDSAERFAAEIIGSVAAGGDWAGEVPLQRKDGSRFISFSNISCIKGERGPTQYFFNIFSDFSEELARRSELAQAKESAERANQAKSEFLSGMSHELRTPMNAIIGFSQLMEYDDTLPDEHKDNVHEIIKAGHLLLELINEVLDLAKIESGHIDLSMEPVEVGAIVQECLNLVRPLADNRDIKLSHSELHGAAVLADRTRLRQVLLNLLSNAIKYNRAGGSVRLEVRPQGTDRLRILVTDTGPGIPAVRLGELFQPFNRLNAENSGIEGTGIGLAITRRIVELMGGSVDVDSEVGVGSTFWIEFPLSSLPESDHGVADSATPLQRLDAVRHTVLYIDDNPVNLKLIGQILGLRGHIELRTAHTPALGIELALTCSPDLILLDINMPGMNGYQVLEVLRAEASLNAIPVVAVTANAMLRDIERGREAGFTEYITKPLDVTKFIEMIDRLLGGGPTRKEELS